jgi:hypothetical protein
MCNLACELLCWTQDQIDKDQILVKSGGGGGGGGGCFPFGNNLLLMYIFITLDIISKIHTITISLIVDL